MRLLILCAVMMLSPRARGEFTDIRAPRFEQKPRPGTRTADLLRDQGLTGYECKRAMNLPECATGMQQLCYADGKVLKDGDPEYFHCTVDSKPAGPAQSDGHPCPARWARQCDQDVLGDAPPQGQLRVICRSAYGAKACLESGNAEYGYCIEGHRMYWVAGQALVPAAHDCEGPGVAEAAGPDKS